MKKNWIKTLALGALLFVGAAHAGAQAQRGYDVPALNPDIATLADQVIDLQLSDPDKANTQFNKLIRKISKDKEQLLSAGQYFLDKNVYPCANQCAKQLYTLAPDYIPGLMFNGEVSMFRKDYGGAGQKFDEVLAIDPTFVPALKRNAFVYKNVNPHVAIEMLEKIKEIEPSNMTTVRDLGDIRYNLDEFQAAVDNYKTYFDAVKQNDETDIRAAENYMLSLFATQQFEEIGSNVDRFAALDPKDMIFKRMKFISDVESYKLTEAKDDMGYITSGEYADSLIMYLDYMYAAELMDQLEDTPAAVGFQEKAVAADPSKTAALKKLAQLYSRNNQIDEGLATYQKYLDAQGENVSARDQFGLGQQYVRASKRQDVSAEKKAEYIKGGDEIFLKILEKQPDFYQAALMRAALHVTDPSQPQDEPKALYIEALKLMEGREGIDSAKLQALSYLAFYAVQKDLEDDARSYVDQILAIDSENATGIQIDKYLKSIGK